MLHCNLLLYNSYYYFKILWYLTDEAAQIACGITLHAVSHHNPDILKRHAALVMPFVFFAMHEQKDIEKGGPEFLFLFFSFFRSTFINPFANRMTFLSFFSSNSM